ncbi:putative N-acetylmuramoyl-L-alanine amidase CwlD [Clostridium sp. CAG:1013]|nr:putative N-acetylmuramoyl-L-alanine amidase CwlD [Clostridium sp. CAG:1013]
MKRKLFFWVLFCASLVLFCAQTMEAFGVVAFHADFFEKKGTIVIDAGHGGEDGGAVGVNGLVEKDINLAIALALAEDLKANNFDVVLVRDGDYSVGDQSLSTVAERKRSDTKRRVSLVEETGDCLLVSIHQNQFSQSQYSGAQMFYSPNNEESAQLAECIRQSVVSSLQPENTRQNKEAGEEIYLLTHCQVPAVLVECGFLSNPQEADLLGQESYQNDMAAAIYNGIIDFLEQREEAPA